MDKSRLWLFAVILLLVGPLLFHAWALLAESARSPHVPFGDEAILEIFTIHAADWSQLLGPYSRYSWNHPGPLFFYLTMPMYGLLNDRSISLYLVAFILNIISIMTIVTLCSVVFPRRFLPMIALLFALSIHSFGLSRLFSPSPPYVTVFPFIMLVFLCAGLAGGRLKLLPAIAITASFLVQTHVGYTAHSVFFALLAGALYILTCRHTGCEKKRDKPLMLVLLTILVTVLLWSPVIIEETSNVPGNLSKLTDFFSQGHCEHGFQEALITLSREFSSILSPVFNWFHSGADQGFVKIVNLVFLWSVIILCSLVVLDSGWKASFSHRYSLKILSMFVLSGTLIAFVDIMAIRGPLHDYLVLWTSSFGLMGSMVGLCWLLQQVRAVFGESAGDRIVRVVSIISMVLLLVNGYRTIQMPMPDIGTSPEVRKTIEVASEKIIASCSRHGIELPLVQLRNRDSWPLVAGIVLQLFKDSRAFVLDDNWLFMFGRQFKDTGRHDGVIIIGDRLLHHKLAERAEYIPVFARDDMVVFLFRGHKTSVLY